MQNDKRGLLEVLKAELKAIEGGQYRHPFGNDWRAQFIFEESPACLNYNACAAKRVSCSDCVLMPLIPAERRFAKVPCCHIPLNRAGETLETLYRPANQSEIEIILRRWLQAQIERLEVKRVAVGKPYANVKIISADSASDQQRRHRVQADSSHDSASA